MRQIQQTDESTPTVGLIDVAIAALELDRTDGPDVSWSDLKAKAEELASQRSTKRT